MSKTLVIGAVIFVAASAIFGWHIYTGLRSGVVSEGYERSKSPARYWTMIAFEIFTLALIAYGLFPALRQIMK